jgi:hypothetical protein
MAKLVLAASLLAALILTACGAPAPAPSQPAVVPSAPPASPAPSVPADPATPQPSGQPAVTPAPTARPTARPTTQPTPRPTEPSFSRAEQYLIDGIMRGEGDCSPVRSGLPDRAVAGIDCDLIGSPVARVGYYLFKNEGDMLDVYIARMRAEGIALESGGCWEGEGEASYIPWGDDGISPYRVGCFVNDEGYANFRATLPGSHVYVGLLGRTENMEALHEWAFYGNQDTPSHPTLWQQSFVYRS